MATRLWFARTDPGPVSPAFDSAWETTSAALVRRLTTIKGVSPIGAGLTISWTAGQDGLDRQYVSEQLAAGVVFDTGVSVKGQLMVREFAAGDNSSHLKLGVRVVSLDGQTVRATLLAVANYSTTAEFVNNATMRNKTFANGDLLTGSYTTVLGDRLVVELGYSDASGSTPQAAAKWGEDGTDLPENETQTTDGAGWIEFSNSIVVIGDYPQPLMGLPQRRARRFVAS